MNNEIFVDSDLKVEIKRIQQWFTYDGLLEGLPTTKKNNRILQDVRDAARNFCHIDEIYVLETIQTPIPYDKKYPFGEPASLPAVTCIAELWHHKTFRHAEMDYSSLAIVWFQEEFAFPVDPEILEKMKQVPYKKYAVSLIIEIANEQNKEMVYQINDTPFYIKLPHPQALSDSHGM